jgi:glycosyltransferase involved in cell wall biosynthesis
MKCRPVFILLNVNKDANSVEEILQRQLRYVESYRSLVGVNSSKPLILVSGAKLDADKSNSLVELVEISEKPTNLFSFAIRALRHLKTIRLPNEYFYIVAGTPLRPLPIGSFLKSNLKGSKLQVSIHNDLQSWHTGGLGNLVKRINFRLSLSKVDLFRFVSSEQREIACNLYKISEEKTVVCPIPIEVPSISSSHRNSSMPTLGFVGRAHVDRGVKEWIEIANMLKGFFYLVVGDGPLLELFRRELPTATLKGRVPHKDVSKVYEDISVLLSSAPFESYGLAIREALLRGIPVVTRKTAGTKELRDRFPEIIVGYDTVEEAALAIARFSGFIESKFFADYRDWFEKKQNADLRDLVSHWV